MTVVLTLVQSPHPQPVRQMRLDQGELVIGRAAEADWRIDDPDMFVSRAHCTVSGGAGRFTVTDTSSGGLFLDEAPRPLGHGNSAPLRHGMRMRFGEFVVQVEMAEARAAAPADPPARPQAPMRSQPQLQPQPQAQPAFDADGFFATPPPPEPRRERPSDLPDPFERPRPRQAPPPERVAPPDFDDPFTLDPLPSPRERAPATGFDWGDPPAGSEPPAPRSRDRPAAPAGFDWDAPPPAPEPEPGAPRSRERPAPVDPEPAPARAEPRRTAHETDGADEAFAAFLRGLGLDAADAPPGDPVERMEALGREYRMMVEGLMHLLMMRAEEKSNARIAQTVVGAAEVNPLKFMPTVEDALAVMLAARSAGFADAEGAIAGAVRDLASHHVGAWRGIQAALRRMVDRFDPKALEAELAAVGALEKLLAGGRRAKLWELYEKRYREIARSAETRFMGEVGADFRDAYETGEK